MSEKRKYKFELPDDSSEAVIIRGSTSIEFNASGGLFIHTNGDVKIARAANDDAQRPDSNADPKPGDRMADGTVYAGISPDTGRPMYVTPTDAPQKMTWREAIDCARLQDHGHKDWRLPTKSELNVLFNNRAAIGGFDDSGSWPSGYYWCSSESVNGLAWLQRFSDGSQGDGDKRLALSVRCARG